MRTALTLILIFIVSTIAVAIVCAVNAPMWMDGRAVAATQPA